MVIPNITDIDVLISVKNGITTPMGMIYHHGPTKINTVVAMSHLEAWLLTVLTNLKLLFDIMPTLIVLLTTVLLINGWCS